MKNGMVNVVLISALLLIVVHTNWRVRDKYLELKYDLLQENPEVYSKKIIENKLVQLFA
jgi:hypothetical protein